MTRMTSIGNSIRNFFSTTVTVDSYQKGENSAKDSITTTLDKSIIRKALFQGCGLIGMLKGMKAIRQADCNLTKVGELKGRLGCAMDVIKKTIKRRSATAPKRGVAGQSGQKNGVDEFKAMVRDRSFAEVLNQYEKHAMPNEDDPLGRPFYDTKGIEYLIENNPKVTDAELQETDTQLNLANISVQNKTPTNPNNGVKIVKMKAGNE